MSSPRHLTGGQLALERVHKMIRNRLFEKLVDFDNHLDDIQLDWTNSAITLAVESPEYTEDL